MNHTLSIASLLAVIVCLSSCRNDEKSTSEPEPVQQSSWISDDPEQWPQLVLTNLASFQGHTSLSGASGFLAENSRGEIFYATAAHVLGPNGGVKPEIRQSALDAVLKSWIAYPRTLENSAVTITGSAGVPSRDPNNDWALLKIDQPNGRLPSEPLKFRRKRVEVGEKVYLIGVPYSEPDEAQNVYAGIVTAREHNDRFRFDLSPPVDIRGFSGAPIIDGAGLVVGVMTIWFETRMEGNRDLEAGGEDAAAAYNRLEASNL